MKNVLVVLSGPSGVGKGTIAKKLIKRNSDMFLSVSCTTRMPRKGEKDAVDYFFITKEEFLDKISKDDFLEYSEHFENFYGTPKSYVIEKLKTKDGILEIDVNGGLNVKKNCQNAILIMILPPSLEELKNRLIKRKTESLDKIELRMKRIEYELSKKDLYDYVVINDDLSETIEKIENIIKTVKNG